MARPPADRRDGMAALDDAGYRARRRLPLGLCAAAARGPDLRHDLGAAARLHLARHAAVGAGDVERLRATLVRSRGMLARAWRELAADYAPHHDRAGVAIVRGRLG